MIAIRRFSHITGFIVILAIGGCVAAYPIEDRRIGSYCKSLMPGVTASSAMAKADSMIGTKIWQQHGKENFVVKSRFTYKTLCMVSVAGGQVSDASFSSD